MSKVFTITEGLENMGALRTGGQGSVYKGRRIGPIISAVKLLPTPIHTEDKEDKNFRNFQNEVEKLKKVNQEPNPNVVKILNSGLTESGSFPYIEMEFIEGPDLEELLKPPHEKIFTLKEVIKVADHLANALAHCHKVGVKHGDIKSNNVKYNIHSGNYVLLDFGLAIMSDEQRRTSIRHAGAIEFMAPEQNTGAMLMQTDVYGYGIILYELLAGQVPFPLHDSGETSRNAVMIAHMELPVPNLLELRKRNMPASWPKEKQEHEMRVPQWLLQMIAKCLEKDPANRYSNGLALQEALVYDSLILDQQPAIAGHITDKETVVNKPAILHDDTGKMLVSKFLFITLIILFFASLASTAYLLSQKKPKVVSATQPLKESLPAQNPDTTPNTKIGDDYRERMKRIDSANKSAINDEIEKDRQKASTPSGDSTNTATDTANNVRQPDNY